MTKLFYILAFVLIAVPCYATDYYINPDVVGGTQDGLTPTNAYDSWADASITNGNDYRQLCGTSETTTLSITNSGSDGNRIIIGAYNADGSHEDGKEVYGATCSGGLAKPIIRDSDDTGQTILITGQYITLSSIEVQYSAEAIDLKNSNNIIEYCHIGQDTTQYGVRVGLSGDGDNNIIRYNIIDSHDAPAESTLEGIVFHGLAQNNEVYNNYITRWGHSGVFFSKGDSNEVYNNYILDSNNIMSEAVLWNKDANYNKLHHNWIEGSNLQIQGGQYNEIYYNVITGIDNGDSGYGAIEIINEENYPSDHNKIYNNTLYDIDCRGIRFYARSAQSPGTINNNEVINNIILDTAEYCLGYNDESDEISGTIWRNNSCYDYPTNQYARIIDPGSTVYTTATDFNDIGGASGNRGDDPGLKDVNNSELWPADSDSNIVGAGCDMNDSDAACYDAAYTASENILDPDTTDFTTSPPTVGLVAQDPAWTIGAFDYPGDSPVVNTPLQGVTITGGKYN